MSSSVPDAASQAQPGINLSDAWATGTTAEPAAARLDLRLECNHSPALWVLQQNGDTVRLWLFKESYAQGIPSPRNITPVAAEGRIAGAEVAMGGPGARYLLHYDSTTAHLRGTLNGGPFWAVRLNIIRPDHCIAVP